MQQHVKGRVIVLGRVATRPYGTALVEARRDTPKEGAAMPKFDPRELLGILIAAQIQSWMLAYNFAIDLAGAWLDAAHRAAAAWCAR